MANYYIYRINVGYDGFYPNRIKDRLKGGKFIYNWRAYFDNLEIGDIVLTYFLGSRCRDGIFAVTQVEKIMPQKVDQNVVAELIYFSEKNHSPIIDRKSNQDIFREIMYRPRGAEIIVWAHKEKHIIDLLKGCNELQSQLAKLNITLPGISLPLSFSIDNIPIIDLHNDIGRKIQDRNIVSAFWIRPRQATWIRSLSWLTTVSLLFYKFKSGDQSYIPAFSKRLANQISRYFSENGIKVKYIVGVPLSEAKKGFGEIDRVDCVCNELSSILKIKYLRVLKLKGNISRTNYKRIGYSTSKFIKDYTDNLRTIKTKKRILQENPGSILLVDDVFTDGVTTSTIEQFLIKDVGRSAGDIYVATIGIMAKIENISSTLKRCWHT